MRASKQSPARLCLDPARFRRQVRANFGKRCTDRQLATVLGVHFATLSVFLNGHRPPNAEFVAACIDVFGCRFEDVFTVESVETNLTLTRAAA